jgi:hypothetical protein
MGGGHVLAGLGRERVESRGPLVGGEGPRCAGREDKRNIAGIPTRKKIR